MEPRVIRRGTWLYDGTVERPVEIIALDYDWWYELAREEEQLEPGEEPEPLSPNGFLYYVRFQGAGRPWPTWLDSHGHQSPEAAAAYAESKVPGGITWER